MELFFSMVAWIFGILWGLYLKQGIVLFVFILFLIYYFRKKNRYLKLFCTKRLILICLFCYLFSYFQVIQLEKSFQEKYKSVEGEIKVVGTIISNPSLKEYKTVYTIKVESINGNTNYKNTNLLLNIKKSKEQKEYTYGNKIEFIGEFEEPSVKRNKGGFDYKQYLKTKNIYGIVTTKGKKIKVIKQNNINIISKTANIIANKIQEKAYKLLPEKEASILIGILLGDKQNLEEEIKESFRISNLSHMLAVSGAHVSYVIMGISFFIAKIKVSKKSGKIITILLLLFFILMTGNTPSVTRACFMSVYMILASLFHKRVSVISSISISMLLLMFINPYCIFDVGLQLSYGGTIGIVFFYPPLKKLLQKRQKERIVQNKIEKYKQKVLGKIQEMILLTINANIILIPIILYQFNTISLTFIVSNILASPIMGVLVLLGFITIILSFVFPLLAEFLAIFLKVFLNLFLQIATFTAKLPFSQIYLATPKLWVIILYYFIIFICLFYMKIKGKKAKRRIEKKWLKSLNKINKKKIFIIFLIFLVLNFSYKQIPKELKIHFIDVGQGDSTLLITPRGKTVLIDGGGTRENEFDVGEKTLLPYLLERGVTKLDYIIISHFDDDHVRTDYLL